MEIQIRKAVISDIPSIFNLVLELAVYEKEPDAVEATIADFESAFEDNVFDSYVATHEDQVIGMALFYMTFSTWKGRCLYLEDFYVQPEYRKHSIGQRLFNAFVEEAKRQNVPMAKWQILDWNEPALSFYRKNQATIETNWWNGKLFFKDGKSTKTL